MAFTIALAGKGGTGKTTLAALIVPAVLFLATCGVIDRDRGSRQQSLPLTSAVIATIVPFLFYVYLPVRSRLGALPNWDEPETWHRFWVHITARQYHDLLGSQGLSGDELQRFFVEQLPGEASWVLIVLAVVGLAVMLWRAWRGAVITLLTAGASLLYNLAYPIHDIALYYIPLLVVFGIWAAVGSGMLVWLAGRLAARLISLRTRRVTPSRTIIGLKGVLTTALCATCLVPLSNNWQNNDQSEFRLLSRYVPDVLTNTAPAAIVFAGNWGSFSSPALYYQLVNGVRPDVTVLDLGRLASPRLASYLAQVRPEIAEACRGELVRADKLANKE